MNKMLELARAEGHKPDKKWLYGYDESAYITLWPEGDHCCKECGGPIPLHRYNSTCHWLRKKFCSQRCKAKHQVGRPSGKRVEPEAKKCLSCGRKFQRRAKDALSDFKRRKTCGRSACRKALTAESVKTAWPQRRANT